MDKKTVVLGVTGSIAAYKAVEIASQLKKRGVDVFAVLTSGAAKFVSKLTFETITGNPAALDMFERDNPWEVEHIALAKRADLFLIAPATANFIGKYANGIADDMLTTTAMATNAPVMIAPAMNSGMYTSKANTANMAKLAAWGVRFVEPESGVLACGDVGVGRLASPEAIVDAALHALYPRRDYEGKRVLVTAGPTREAIDPVRFISNRSSGKMGFAVAAAARDRGADVTLVCGPVSIPYPTGVEVIKVTTTEEMYNAVTSAFKKADICVKAAAPADFTVEAVSEQKIKKSADGDDAPVLVLKRTKDILAALGQSKGNRFLCGFAAETTDVERYATEKLARKNLDMIVANNVSKEGAGFDVDTNTVIIYTRDGNKKELSGTKREVAEGLLTEIALRFG